DCERSPRKPLRMQTLLTFSVRMRVIAAWHGRCPQHARRMTPMLATIVFQIPLALFPGFTPPPCQLEALTTTALEERALQDFDRRVHWYVRLHRRLERS